ncbi:aminoglycoside phosphotransferase family protein [Kribbella antibiotica]|uniref:Aminoglycoside phosphotransferase family protein n=1 Tax=Kribbella antibiotica TaxID=190195 RepID=A0A4R4YZ57_9ACTN|nr:aminoglycoside phosphotransferase family protein [Kribbella antibiotica]TDD49769.1 aminoglycoside phosphotransferase family protein [Kribbella antibiotica]
MSEDDGTAARARAVESNAAFRPVRVAEGVVSRPAGAQTATVHAFFGYLREQGLADAIPEPLSNDGTTETLRIVEGDAGGDAWRYQHSLEGVESAARLLRRIHDASRGWVPPVDAVFGQTVLARSGQVFCHGDPGPWNFAWRDGQAVGLFDWDYLHPGDPVDDVAYALFWFTPTRADHHCLDWHHFPAVPDRRERIQHFLSAYGPTRPFDVVDAIIKRGQATINLELSLAAQGIEPQRTWVADGVVDEEAAELRWVADNRALLTPSGARRVPMDG